MTPVSPSALWARFSSVKVAFLSSIRANGTTPAASMRLFPKFRHVSVPLHSMAEASSAAPVPSEMVLMRKYYGDSPRIDKVFPNRIISYKMHVKNNVLPGGVLDMASIVYFHGHPKPHHLTGNRWVQENWR